MKNGFDQVIGYDAIKTELARISDSLKNREAYAKLGVSSPRGLLLHGDPGVGKTIMANAVIEESGRKAFVCRKDLPNGAFVKAIKSVFAKAKEAAPSIVFLDDMDKFANVDEDHPDAEEYVTVQSCIDALKGSDVFVLATANSIWDLPPSLLRAGRFDRVIEVEAPHDADAVSIVKHYLAEKKTVADIDAEFVAHIMHGRSCAEIETIINEAGFYAGYARSEQITMEHFIEACARILHGASYIDRKEELDDAACDALLSDGNNMLTQIVYHEAGHTAVAEILIPQSVTIVSAQYRSGTPSGFTGEYSVGNTLLRLWQQNQIMIELSGMASVEQKFGIQCSGASDDLDKVFRRARLLVESDCVCGFGLHEIGYGESDALTQRRENAIAIEVEKHYRKTKEILARNREFVEKIAFALMQKGMITALDIAEIKSTCKIVPVSI